MSNRPCPLRREARCHSNTRCIRRYAGRYRHPLVTLSQWRSRDGAVIIRRCARSASFSIAPMRSAIASLLPSRASSERPAISSPRPNARIAGWTPRVRGRSRAPLPGPRRVLPDVRSAVMFTSKRRARRCSRSPSTSFRREAGSRRSSNPSPRTCASCQRWITKRDGRRGSRARCSANAGRAACTRSARSAVARSTLARATPVARPLRERTSRLPIRAPISHARSTPRSRDSSARSRSAASRQSPCCSNESCSRSFDSPRELEERGLCAPPQRARERRREMRCFA